MAATVPELESATQGFSHFFNDDLEQARNVLNEGTTPFHLLGLGVVTFMQAALGMEDNVLPQATEALAKAEASAKAAHKAAKSLTPYGQFPAGIEWEILHADAVLLHGLTLALSESYMGYLQCMYSLNNSHGKFNKIFKTVFPNGLDAYPTPATSRNASSTNLRSSLAAPSTGRSLFGRWASPSSTSLATPEVSGDSQPQGPLDELVVSGAAFGFGLFNLVFSLLPGSVKRVVGLFGFQSDRQLGLRALAVAAKGKDVHSNFAASLVLMTYQGVVLLMSGYQADESHILKQYGAMLDSVESRFPNGSLWLLNRAKLARYTGNAAKAISILQSGLGPERPVRFIQADTMLVFELAWILLAERQYEQSAETFLKLLTLNTWSHATYTFMAAGCYIAMNTPDARQKARALLDTVPSLLDRRKMGGKDLPAEVYIRKKLAFYKRKQVRWSGEEKEADYIDCIRMSPAEEMAIFWNTHQRITKEAAEAHINDLLVFTPRVSLASPYSASLPLPPAGKRDDLDTPDELSVRDLLLGILHRSAGHFGPSRTFLAAATQREVEGKWVLCHAWFELAVLDVLEAQAADSGGEAEIEGPKPNKNGRAAGNAWRGALKSAGDHLEKASSGSANTDLSSRLDSRITMLRDELENKKRMLGISL